MKMRLRKNNQIIHMPLQVYNYHQFTIDECKITVILIVEVPDRGTKKLKNFLSIQKLFTRLWAFLSPRD